jgi:threonine dehydratase
MDRRSSSKTMIADDAKPLSLVGVDACRKGWIAVVARAGRFDEAQVMLAETFADVLHHVGVPALVAVDMPIGLPEIAERRGRAAEIALRAVLGPRRASVFGIPSRRAVHAYNEGRNYQHVCAIARATSGDDAWAPSKQAFNIFDRIIEIDDVLCRDSELRERVYEVHPELSFALMKGSPDGLVPLDLPKKKNGKLNPLGLAERRRLLIEHGFVETFLDQPLPKISKGPKPALDDFFDACATFWSARRIFERRAIAFPSQVTHDAFGLRMTING